MKPYLICPSCGFDGGMNCRGKQNLQLRNAIALIRKHRTSRIKSDRALV